LAGTASQQGEAMTKPTTLTLSTPDDVLAAVPLLLGFHPEESLVVLTAGGPGRPFHARVDLPESTEAMNQLVDYLTEVVLRHRVERLVLVVYSDDGVLAEDLVGALEDALYGHTQVMQAIQADGRRWYCLADCDRCPVGGAPYDLRSHPFTAQAVYEGQAAFASREEVADSLVGTDPDAVEEVARAAEAAERRWRGAGRTPLGAPLPDGEATLVAAEGRWVEQQVRAWTGSETTPDARDAGRLLVALRRVAICHVAWSMLTRSVASEHVDLWRDVVRRCPVELRAAPAALLGFAAWLSGSGALAWCAIERCQEAEPDYPLAQLLAEILISARPPDTWQPPVSGMGGSCAS
jgi:hypothetical protein